MNIMKGINNKRHAEKEDPTPQQTIFRVKQLYKRRKIGQMKILNVFKKKYIYMRKTFELMVIMTDTMR